MTPHEEFEEWKKQNIKCPNASLWSKDDAKAAYLAGRNAGIEQAAKVAKQRHNTKDWAYKATLKLKDGWMRDKLREVVLDSQNILYDLFFGPTPVFSKLMETEINPLFAGRYATQEDKISVLLSVFAVKEYRHVVETERIRAKFMDSLLTPQAGEAVH